MNTQDKLVDVNGLNLTAAAIMTKVYDVHNHTLALKQHLDITI